MFFSFGIVGAEARTQKVGDGFSDGGDWKGLVVQGERKKVRHFMHEVCADFCREGRNVLFVDTTNSLNPHHGAFSDGLQRVYFKRTYCVRAPLPYDLWARLGSAEGFVEKKKIGLIVVSSLSLVFRDCNKNESKFVVENILRRLERLFHKKDVRIVVGSSLIDDDCVKEAYAVLEKRRAKWAILYIQ